MKACWNLTNQCNRLCNFCFREKKLIDLTLSENMIVLKNLGDNGFTKITFAGGEPFMYKGILELLKKSKTLGIYNKINTNASFLNDNNIEEFLENVDKIGFSVDSIDDRFNEFIGRGKDHYKHIREIIPLIKKIYPNIKIDINTVVTSQTILGINNIYKELEFLGDGVISRWKLIRFCPIREMSDKVNSFYQINNLYFEELRKKYENIDSKFQIEVVDNDETIGKNVVNPNGLLQYYCGDNQEILDLAKEDAKIKKLTK